MSALLLDLAIGVHHFAMYPKDHPAQQPAVDAIMGHLSAVFLDRRALTIGVASHQLVIEGAATDPSQPALSELARRIHKHQLGALVFNRGVKATEIREVLATLAQEVDIAGTPLGLLPADEFPTWENARFFRIGYEDLELRDGGSGGGDGTDRASALWLGLAQVAMPEDLKLEHGPDGTLLAAAVKDGGKDRTERVAEYVRHLAYELRGARGHAAEEVRRRLSRFLENLDEGTLAHLVDFGGSFSRRQRFLLDANQSLSTDAVLRLLLATANRSEQGISQAMTRLLSKLSVHAQSGGAEVRTLADTAVRDNVEALLQGWELKDPNPDEYTLELDAMSRSAPIFQAPDPGHELMGAARLIQMAVEVDADGPIVRSAVPAFVAERGVGPLLDLLAKAPEANRVAERIRSFLATPSRFRLNLSDGRFDPRSLRAMVGLVGKAAVEPMLDVMEVSESRAVRRMIFDALAEMDSTVPRRLAERLKDEPWFVLRNNLTLLDRFDELPPGFDPGLYLTHADVRVRRAALPLALRFPERREATLRAALAEEDGYMVRRALLALVDGVPDDLQQVVADRVVLNRSRSDELRALGARVLAPTGTPLARATLLRVTSAGKTLLGRPKMHPKSGLLLAALRALARVWPDDPEASAIVGQASRSKDEDIAACVQSLDDEPAEEAQPEEPA